MPKKMLNKKIKKLIESQDLESLIEEESHAKVFDQIEKEVILEKLNSVNVQERENITSIIGSMEMNENDESLRNKLLNKDFVLSLVDKLNDPFLQVRYNALMAIMNILISYGSNDSDLLYIRDAKMFGQIEKNIKDYISNINMNIIYSDSEKEIHNKIFLLIYDLLLLVVENFQDNRDHFINLNDLLDCSVFIVTNTSHFSEELIIKVCFFLANLSSIKIIPYKNSFQNLYEICSKVIFENKDSNFLIRASFTCFVFYSLCYNDCLASVFQLSNVVENIYSSLNSSNLLLEVKNLTNDLDKLLSGIEKDEDVQNKHLSENINQSNIIVENQLEPPKKIASLDEASIEKIKISFKHKIKQLEEKINGYIIYLKTLVDITNGIDSIKGKGGEKDDEDDEIYEDYIEDENDEGSRIDNIISKNVNQLFNPQNITVIFNKNFLVKLISHCNIDLDQYIFNDFDKLIVIKELLYDFEYFSVSLLNNVINNLDLLKQLNDLSLEKEIYHFAFKKLTSTAVINNSDYLGLILTLLRNVLENNKNVMEIIKEEFNYKSLLLVMNKNINDPMIKMNVIDIISFVFSKLPHSQDINEEICVVLFNFCLNENDIEVLAHVMNSFMDIWSEDHYNYILKKLEIIEKMKIGLNDYRNKIKTAFKARIIDEETRKYCNLAVTNIKSFITYKEKMYQSQNLV